MHLDSNLAALTVYLEHGGSGEDGLILDHRGLVFEEAGVAGVMMLV